MPFPRRGTGALPRSRVEPEPEQNPDGIHLADHPAVQHGVYLAAFWPQKGQSAIEMVGGELPGWVAARDDGTVVVSSDLEVVRQTLCADIDAERIAKEVYPRYVVASLSSAATPSTAPLPQHPTTYIICERDQASPPQAQEAMSSAADHVIRLSSSHSSFLSMPKQLARTLGGAVSSA
jgi:alpha/beta hydrolase family protein